MTTAPQALIVDSAAQVQVEEKSSYMKLFIEVQIALECDYFILSAANKFISQRRRLSPASFEMLHCRPTLRSIKRRARLLFLISVFAHVTSGLQTVYLGTRLTKYAF